jgi:5-methyltetrahydrofolate--homocysteine methyltransferase
VYRFINEVALIRGQWRVVAGSLSQRDYQALLESQIHPELERLKRTAKESGLLEPKVVYGHFPCQSDGNNLVVYDPESLAPDGTLQGTRGRELARFAFPRQSHRPYLCISDFFAHVGSGLTDVVSFHLVTMGQKASAHSKKLFDANNYKEYLYFHGLSVESAEALAELWHQRIRQELGIAGRDAPEIRKLFAQGYQGSRYSFGYPACPNLEDQTKLFTLLRPERIGVELTEEFQLEPEQSTSAIVVHHPQARYFNVR